MLERQESPKSLNRHDAFEILFINFPQFKVSIEAFRSSTPKYGVETDIKMKKYNIKDNHQ